MFWKNRNRLKRTLLLIINLGVAHLFVGFTQTISIGAFVISGHLVDENFNSARSRNISIAFKITFGFGSVLFLSLISLERAHAMIWPLRHRAASTGSYIHSATLAWIAAIFAGALTLLTVLDIVGFAYLEVALGSSKGLCLVTMCLIWESEQDLSRSSCYR